MTYDPKVLNSEADIRADERERIIRRIGKLLYPDDAALVIRLTKAIRQNDGQLVLTELPVGRNPYTGVPQDPSAPEWPYSKPEPGPDHKQCQSNNDGECIWRFCPQRIEGEPEKSGRSCPFYSWSDE